MYASGKKKEKLRQSRITIISRKKHKDTGGSKDKI